MDAYAYGKITERAFLLMKYKVCPFLGFLWLLIVQFVILIWIFTLTSALDEKFLLLTDASLLGLGFIILLFTQEMLSLNLLLCYFFNISFFATGLYILAPIYRTLTRSICSDSIWAITISLLLLHLFPHDYSGPTIRAPRNPPLTSFVSVHASAVASLFVASHLPSRLLVSAIMLFFLQVFLFATLVTYKYSSRL